jgi:hypothetical protein
VGFFNRKGEIEEHSCSSLTTNFIEPLLEICQKSDNKVSTLLGETGKSPGKG